MLVCGGVNEVGRGALVPGNDDVSDPPGGRHKSVLSWLDKPSVLCDDPLQIPAPVLNIPEYSPRQSQVVIRVDVYLHGSLAVDWATLASEAWLTWTADGLTELRDGARPSCLVARLSPERGGPGCPQTG